MVSALEYAPCVRHYHDEIPTSELCKVPSIQRSLAEIRGWAASFETFSAIIVALPIGRIADHRGQRGVFMVVVAGILMNLTWTLVVLTNLVLPIKLVWASSLFLLVGGGSMNRGNQTNALISEVALVNLGLFFFIMPALLRIVSKYLKPIPQVLNLGIVRASLLLLLLGSLLLAFAKNSAFLIAATMIYGLGFGARSTLLSLVTSWIDPKQAGTLFSAVFLVEQIGMLGGGEPLAQNVLGISLGLQDPWKGLPFICTAWIDRNMDVNIELFRSMPSRTASRSSSSYFQSSDSQAHLDNTAVRNSLAPRRPQTSLSEYSGYDHSGNSTRPNISRPSTVRPGSRPGTASGRKSRNGTASSILGLSEAQTIVCAVSEARGVSPAVGIAFVNVSLGEAVISQICDNQSYVKTIHKIQLSAPSRILFMTTACPPNNPSSLFSLVQDLIPDVQIDALERSAWSETEGLEYIHNLAFKDDIEPLKVATQGKFYAICSLAAAMKYIQQHFSINFVPHSLRILYRPSEDTMMIDISAIQSLEIMQNIRNSKSKDSLFGLLNHTCTPMGSRMLRSNILQPPTRPDLFITPRYDALDELTTNEEMFLEIRKGKLIIVPTNADVQQVEEQINQVLMIKSFLESIPELHTALGPANSVLLTKVRELCRPQITSHSLNTIRLTIEADVTYMKSALDLRNQRTFAVKAGINGMLDVARQTYKELTEDIHQHIDALNEAHGLDANLRYDNGRKYWLRLRAADFDDRPLPDLLINVVRKKDKIECQTLDLVKLNLRLSDTSNEVVIRSDKVIQDLLKELRSDVPHLFRVCESVALVDMITSFAQLATTRDYVKPDLSTTLALKAARHPVLDKTMNGTFVPNDYYSTEQYCFHIVTGCNMSGKSTYIRAVALLQIMAQIGSFVPAEYAAFPIIHSIFARVSLDDNIESNLSTFSVEMREMSFILRNIDDKSLAVIDELGRATSNRDGLAIAIAMSEALILSKASIWFATHYVDLTKVLADRPGILNLHLAATTSTTEDGLPHITMLYKATSGAIRGEEHYGINLARAIGLPQSFIDKAEEVAKDIRQKRETTKRSSESTRLVARRKLILNLQDALRQAKDSGSEEALPGYLQRLQEDFVARMEEVDNM
ncbi:DNA mismatch repair MSH4 [Fusarium subglutinans]|uniref:DNA mismatch repair protein MSH3 n=1 Tax=Gibberella subglutinans TaxID=42677 RepID=A0A8H5QBK3_GIBSU|nr:DNA mismatch repair MSH4 [Fusarium subglutinans]KAF5611512.1 DNA mismatch repair MSH4 [Fusarium subglutinans]